MGEEAKNKMTMEDLTKTIGEVAEKAIETAMEGHNEKLATDIDEKLNKFAEDFTSKIKVGLEGEAEKDPKAGFKSLSHFAVDVANAARSGHRKISKELGNWDEVVTSKAAGTPSQNVTDGEAGGYLVPEEFRTNLLVAAEEKNELMGRSTRIPMQSSSVRIPYVNGFDKSGGLVYGNVQWLWTDEEETRTAKNVKFGYVNLNLNKLAGMAYVSDEIIKFSPMSITNLLQRGFTDGFNFEMNRVILKGSGAGQPQGILNSPAFVSQAKETGQGADTIVWENIINMYSRLYDKSSAVWVCNPDTLPQLASMSLAVGTGGVAVYMPAGGASGKPFDTLMGLPIVWNHHAKTVGDEGDIVLADMSQYLLGMLAGNEGSKFDSSLHFKFDTDQETFKWTVYMAGQSWWPSALTPAESSTTLSPFIGLAART
ncbi:MAG: phage major capsid protein [Lutibacter sp.]|uniref:phage major capsid protein n=1 Tax=Lutibacter sp. TaxID=1925666 RepID=UPI0019DD6ED2|nr:phage major capsid protein [Lutibacter sp.]NOR27585.1 phage major capsid protein [Lutibacter sp.]